MFDSRPEVDLVGEAGDGADIVAVALRTRPDVVIMDVHMPGTSGIDATRRIVTQRPEIGVLVLTMYDDDETVFAGLRAGDRGYLLNEAEQDQVVSAVVGVARGEAIFGAAVATRILANFSHAPTVPTRPSRS